MQALLSVTRTRAGGIQAYLYKLYRKLPLLRIRRCWNISGKMLCLLIVGHLGLVKLKPILKREVISLKSAQ